MTTNWNTLRDQAYSIACEHGFHDKEQSLEHFLMLVITELSEAIEADRKGKRANKEQFLRYENSTTYRHCFETYIKDSLEDELADAVIRLLDIAGLCEIDLSIIEHENYPDTYFLKELLREYHKSCSVSKLTEIAYSACTVITDFSLIETKIPLALYVVKTYCAIRNIDLLWHIQKKMLYNKERERLHGKGY